jgi:hypothetical protein
LIFHARHISRRVSPIFEKIKYSSENKIQKSFDFKVLQPKEEGRDAVKARLLLPRLIESNSALVAISGTWAPA